MLSRPRSWDLRNWSSFKELGNNQLELVRDRMRYEYTKRVAKRSQGKEKKRPPKLAEPKHPGAPATLEQILGHPTRDEWGVT